MHHHAAAYAQPSLLTQQPNRKVCGHSAVRCRLFKWESLFGGPPTAPAPPVEVVPYDQLPFPADVVLEDTFLEGRELALAYRATRDGWGALDFHTKCDFKGPCVVLATTAAGVRFGGFNPVGWRSTNDYSASWKAFLFCWPIKSKTSDPPVILRKINSPEAAVFDYARGGPQWAAADLIIGPPKSPVMGGFTGPEITRESTSGDLMVAKCRLGLSYENIPTEYRQTSVFGGDDAVAELQEVEVYYAPEIAAMY